MFICFFNGFGNFHLKWNGPSQQVLCTIIMAEVNWYNWSSILSVSIWVLFMKEDTAKKMLVCVCKVRIMVIGKSIFCHGTHWLTSNVSANGIYKLVRSRVFYLGVPSYTNVSDIFVVIDLHQMHQIILVFLAFFQKKPLTFSFNHLHTHTHTHSLIHSFIPCVCLVFSGFMIPTITKKKTGNDSHKSKRYIINWMVLYTAKYHNDPIWSCHTNHYNFFFVVGVFDKRREKTLMSNETATK